MKKSSKRLKSKKKVRPEKKIKKTGGFPSMVALTIERDENDSNAKYYTVHPIDFSTIDADTAVGIFKFKRVANVAVVRKIKRTVKE